MRSQFELYDVELNKNNALAYVRDVKDEQVIEPVSLKKDFGEKLSAKLQEVREADDKSYGNAFKEANGLLKGVIAKDSNGYGHVDWSTVNLDKMKAISSFDSLYKKPGFVKADLKEPSVYGDFATGNVRESKAGDKAIIVLSSMDETDGISVIADGRNALEQGSVLPVADDTIGLNYASRNAVVEAVANYGFGEDFNHLDDFNQILMSYSDGIVESNDTGVSAIHEIDGSIVDAIDDIKNFSNEKNMTTNDFFKKRTEGSNESVDFINEYTDYLLENATNRNVATHYISNVSFEKKTPVMFGAPGVEQRITNFDEMVVDDDSVKKYASEMKKVGIGTNSKSPYKVFDVLREKEPKDVEENSKKFFDDIDMDF